VKARSIVLLAANFGNALFFSFVLLRMLIFGGTLHEAFLIEPSTTIIWVEVISIWSIIVFDAAWLVQALRNLEK
jgi:hypothetical protein